MAERGHPVRLSAQREPTLPNRILADEISGLRPLADRMSALRARKAATDNLKPCYIFSLTT
jgi:hypothetical protein